MSLLDLPGATALLVPPTMPPTAIEPAPPPMVLPQPPSMPPSTPPLVTYSGIAMYLGPLKGCTVFVDANDDGVDNNGALRTNPDPADPNPNPNPNPNR